MTTYTVDQIKSGDVNPSACFRSFGPIFDVKEQFDYPIRSFIEQSGHWDINGATTISDSDIAVFKELIYSPYDEIYFMQEGTRDEAEWIIVAKTKDYYIYFEAGCDYTGFDCHGGGTFAYLGDWNKLWNMHITQNTRTLMLDSYGYEKLRVDIPAK